MKTENKNELLSDQKIKSTQNLITTGYNFDSKDLTVKDWAITWFETYKKYKVSSGTAKSYEIALRKHILPYIGDIKLSEVRQEMLQKVLNNLQGQSKSQAQKVQLTLNQLFRMAVYNGFIVRNVCEYLELPQTTVGERRALTYDEEKYVVETAKEHYAGTWVMTMLRAGLRPKETVPLMWKNIDLTPGKEAIKVNAAATGKTTRL